MSYNVKEAKKIIGKADWKEFEQFMFGQTMGVDDNGETMIYKCDVENFLHKKKMGKALFFD